MPRKGNGDSQNQESELKLAPGELPWPTEVIIGGATFSPDDLAGALDVVAEWAHQTASAKGFFDDDTDSSEMTLLNLIHREVSEITEHLRVDNPPSEKLPGYTSVEEEIGDIILRTMCYAKEYGYDVSATIAKAIFNEGRPRKFGGKKF